METLLLGSAVVLSLVLLVSGGAKLGDRTGTEDALVALRIPFARMHRAIAALLPVVELLLAVGLWLPWRSVALVSAVLAVCAFAVYTVVIGRALRFEEPVTCACFGTLGSPTVTRRTLARNGVLTAAAGLTVVATVAAVVPGVALVTDPAAVAAAWGLVLLTAAVSVLVVAPGSTATPSRESGVPEDTDLDYVPTPIPFGQLKGADGQLVTLREIPAVEARVLVFLSSTCGPCLRVLDSLEAHRARLSPAARVDAVFSSPVEALEAKVRDLAGDAVWEDPQSNAARVFGISARPAAVLLGADGTVAGGPVTGESEVTALLDDMTQQLREAGLV